MGMAVIFGTLQGRLPVVIDYERELAMPLPLLWLFAVGWRWEVVVIAT